MKSPLKVFSTLVLSASLSLSALVFGQGIASAASTHSACSTWVRLVDVSSNNVHPINFAHVARSGISGAYIKNSEGDNYVNPFWKQDVAGATKAGLPYGGYYFAQPGRADAVASAKWFVASGGATGQLPPALDLEVTHLSAAETVVWAQTWLREVELLAKRTPIIYTGASYSWSSSGVLGFWDLWLAAYPHGYNPVPNSIVCSLPLPRVSSAWASKGWSIWQFTSVGSIWGIERHTDVSVAESKWWAKWTGAGILPPTPGINRYPAAIYAYGSHGSKVVAIQRVLVSGKLLPAKSVDGVYGYQTKAAVVAWQKIIGVKADGIWSAATDTASRKYIAKHGYKPVFTYPVLSVGSTNYTAVRTA